MTKDSEKEKIKWLFCAIAGCIVLSVALQHLGSIFDAAAFLVGLARPFLIGVVLALVLNVPMRMIERKLRKKRPVGRGIRPLSIVLSIVLIVGIVVLVAVLVVPEIVKAVKLLVEIIGNGLYEMETLEDNAALMETAVGQYLAGMDIDWMGMKETLDSFISENGSTFVNYAVSATGTLVSGIVDFAVAVVFAIYILVGKEKLEHQACRLVHVWLPEKFGNALIHVCAVCSSTFQQFIGGQATEACILGTLCMIGMLILRIPYAGMVGALVGVTAMIPIVGAYLSAIVGAVMILTVSPLKAVVFLVYIIILQQLENNLIYPKVVGRKINLPAMWVLAAVFIGGNLGGPIGMLFGVPAASAAYSLIREATDRREQEKGKNKIST